jgi:hypothetical protein
MIIRFGDFDQFSEKAIFLKLGNAIITFPDQIAESSRHFSNSYVKNIFWRHNIETCLSYPKKFRINSI